MIKKHLSVIQNFILVINEFRIFARQRIEKAKAVLQIVLIFFVYDDDDDYYNVAYFRINLVERWKVGYMSFYSRHSFKLFCLVIN